MFLSRSIALLFVLVVPADRYDNRRSPAREDRAGELTYSLPAGDSENRVTLRLNGGNLELSDDDTDALLARRALTQNRNLKQETCIEMTSRHGRPDRSCPTRVCKPLLGYATYVPYYGVVWP